MSDNHRDKNRKRMMHGRKTNAFGVKFVILMILICMTAVSPSMVWASNRENRCETIRVGFFAMDGYHMME